MIYQRTSFTKVFLVICCLLASTVVFAQTTRYAILPRPAKLEERTGTFTLPNKVVISVEKQDARLRLVAEQLAARLTTATGQRPSVTVSSTPKRPGIHFAMDKTGRLAKEGYTLSVSQTAFLLRPVSQRDSSTACSHCCN